MLDGQFGAVRITLRGQDDHLGGAGHQPDSLQGIQSVSIGQTHIQKHQIKIPGFEFFQPIFKQGGRFTGDLHAVEQAEHRVAHFGIIIDNQHFSRIFFPLQSSLVNTSFMARAMALRS